MRAPASSVSTTSRSRVGPVLYALLFVVVLPAALILWARATADVVPLPAVRSLPAGLGLIGLGLAAMFAGMWALWRHGGGLPMNAFPPPRFVVRGAYALVANPIYVGFAFVLCGASLAAGSASGLWFVTPIATLGMVALVVGYERLDLRRRFGAAVRRTRLSLPPAEDRPPTLWERASVFVDVLLPWTALYAAVHVIGKPPDAIDARLRFETGWPVVEWAEWIHLSAYLLVFLTPLVAPSARSLRRFAVAGLVATFVLTLVYVAVPLVSPPRPFEPTSLAGRILAAEAAFHGAAAAVPSAPALWALLCALAWPRRLRLVGWAWALALSAACLATGLSTLAGVVVACALAPFFHFHERVWARLLRWTQAVANSWREWRVGPVRLLNRAFYVGAGGFVGTLLVAVAAGPALMPGFLIAGISALVGAAAWAQWIEGSSALLRPFGFYGGVLGGLAGIALAGALGYSPLILLSASLVGVPWAQGLGRLGCLINGCCHGGPTTPELGIRYRHTRSRVTRIAQLANVPLHPTQLYSILANAVIGVLLLRLCFLGAAPVLMIGLYFMLSGLARFVEESYRDEPQTPTLGGLHLYHWMAIASVIGGAFVTALPSPGPMAVHALTFAGVAVALVLGLLYGFLMGVDFPASNRRFSRLAPADGPVGLLPEEPPHHDSGRELSQLKSA